LQAAFSIFSVGPSPGDFAKYANAAHLIGTEKPLPNRAIRKSVPPEGSPPIFRLARFAPPRLKGGFLLCAIRPRLAQPKNLKKRLHMTDSLETKTAPGGPATSPTMFATARAVRQLLNSHRQRTGRATKPMDQPTTRVAKKLPGYSAESGRIPISMGHVPNMEMTGNSTVVFATWQPGLFVTPMPFRNRQTVPPNDTEVQRVNAPALADLGNIPQLQRFECNGRSRRLSRRVFLELTHDDRATPRRSSRIVFGADNLWVCAKAYPNSLEKNPRKTRGFTSCQFFGTFRAVNKMFHFALSAGSNAPPQLANWNFTLRFCFTASP
jgi:hypothetical protein